MFIESKTAVMSLAAGTAGVMATAGVPEEWSWIRSVAELGSFGLVAFSSMVILLKVAPAFISHLDKARDQFLEALERERLLRQKHVDQIDSSLKRIDESIRDVIKK